MKIFRKFLSIVFALAIIGGCGYFLFLSIRFVFNAVRSTNGNIGAAIIAAAATVLVSVLSVLISKGLERRREIEFKLRERKTPIYEELVSLTFEIAMADKLGNPMSEKDMIKRMGDITPKLIVWGAPSVIKSYSDFRGVVSKATEPKTVGIELILALEDVFRAVRKDLGHSDRVLHRGDILSLYINDIRDYV